MKQQASFEGSKIRGKRSQRIILSAGGHHSLRVNFRENKVSGIRTDRQNQTTSTGEDMSKGITREKALRRNGQHEKNWALQKQ